MKKDPRRDPVLRRIVRALREYGAERIILFGSRARGDALPDSDIRQTDRCSVQVARPHLPPYGSKYSPKKFTQPSLLACLLVKEYLRRGGGAEESIFGSEATVIE